MYDGTSAGKNTCIDFPDKTPEVPYWDCIDGKKNTRLDKFSIKTLKSMRNSLEKHYNAVEEGKSYCKFYLNNYTEKMKYINERIAAYELEQK